VYLKHIDVGGGIHGRLVSFEGKELLEITREHRGMPITGPLIVTAEQFLALADTIFD